jgi:hypothetical protein
MKHLILPILAITLAACDQRGREVSGGGNPENMSATTPAAVPGDTRQEHWSGPTSGKDERTLPHPVSGTPNLDPTPPNPAPVAP